MTRALQESLLIRSQRKGVKHMDYLRSIVWLDVQVATKQVVGVSLSIEHDREVCIEQVEVDGQVIFPSHNRRAKNVDKAGWAHALAETGLQDAGLIEVGDFHEGLSDGFYAMPKLIDMLREQIERELAPIRKTESLPNAAESAEAQGAKKDRRVACAE